MASIGGTITHSPNTSGSDICWVLFHSSDINPIHQLFCQLPLSGLRGDCSFGGSEYWFILAPHLLLTKFWLDFFPPLPSSYFQVPWVAYFLQYFSLSTLLLLFFPPLICVDKRRLRLQFDFESSWHALCKAYRSSAVFLKICSNNTHRIFITNINNKCLLQGPKLQKLVMHSISQHAAH